MTDVTFHPPDEGHWQKYVTSHGILWSSGYLYGQSFEALLEALRECTSDLQLKETVRGLDGHFAFVAFLPTKTIAAVDRVGSIPLSYGRDCHGNWHVDQTGGRLARMLKLKEINSNGAIALAMAGYTIGRDTLFSGLAALSPGDIVVFDPNPETLQYDIYRAWQVESREETVFSNDLTQITLHILEKLISRANGGPIALPLSAGLDSRVIASGLKYLGYRNVHCFSYGLAGNHEAVAAKAISGKLGYEWTFVPFSHKNRRAFFASSDHQGYLKYADNGVSTPFEQDLQAIRALQESGYIDKDAIVVNGNSGDFISGAHVQKPFHTLNGQLTVPERVELIVDTLIRKHFRLWDALATPENDQVLADRLRQEILGLGVGLEAEALHGIYECIECRDRQSKYVVSGQRVYEYAGLEWALPLWDRDYLDFWQTVPLALKVNQKLYRETMIRQDWGGVWGPGWWWDKTISPRWIRAPRLALKSLHAPLGRDLWHKFEKRFLLYWMEIMAGQAVVPYSKAAMDNRGARHAVAWFTEMYLAEKGINWDGRTEKLEHD